MTGAEFTHMAQQLRPLLLHIGHQFFPHGAEEEDVVQESLLRMWMMRDNLEAGAPLEPLATRIAKNVCISMWRKQQLRLATPLDATCSSALPADATLMEREGNELLQQAINELRPSERRVFTLSQDPEMDLTQMALITGMSPRSLSSKLSAARKKLYDYIQHKI